MLVLGRKKGEKIYIGKNIVITVVKGDNIRLGIEAPTDVSVNRGEDVEQNKEGESGKV